MLTCLEALGIHHQRTGEDEISIEGQPWLHAEHVLDCGNSGTTMRMLLGAIAGQGVNATLTGSTGLLRRPMGRVTRPLRMMGAQIKGRDQADKAPLTLHGGKLHGLKYDLPVASAQVKTALLLAGLFAQGKTVLREPGSSRDHSERMLKYLGVEIGFENHEVQLEPLHKPLTGFSMRIPGDTSSAAFLLAAGALVPGSTVCLRDVGVNPTRAGFIEILLAMGADLQINHRRTTAAEPIADLSLESRLLQAISIQGDLVVRAIDEFPIFTVVASQAAGETVLREAAELRLKESDRITTMVAELRKMGAEIEALPDGVRIQGPCRLHGAIVHSHGDHRVAMALAIAALVAHGETVIQGAEIINESFPGFIGVLHDAGVSLV
jgi:3-phosphoshikimate 1-carboxyvinyltransferase